MITAKTGRLRLGRIFVIQLLGNYFKLVNLALNEPCEYVRISIVNPCAVAIRSILVESLEGVVEQPEIMEHSTSQITPRFKSSTEASEAFSDLS